MKKKQILYMQKLPQFNKNVIETGREQQMKWSKEFLVWRTKFLKQYNQKKCKLKIDILMCWLLSGIFVVVVVVHGTVIC